MTRNGSLRALVPGVLVAVVITAIAVAMLSVYRDGPSTPLGSDTPHHIWRMRLVAGEGLDALPSFRDSHLLNAQEDRPGLPVLAATVLAIGGPEAAGFAFVLPAAIAAAIGLAGVGVGLRAIGDPPLTAALYALAVGLSVPVVFAANGPLEQLVASALLLGAAGVVLEVAKGDRRSAATAVVLLVGAWTTHWIVTITVVGALGASAAWFLVVPGIEEGLGGDRRRAARRILAIVGLSAVGALVMSLLARSAPQLPLGVSAERVAENIARQLPSYLTSGLLFAAALGVAVLAARRGQPRAALGPLALWALIPLAGAVAAAFSDSAPFHRLLSVGLSIPVLAAAGSIGLAIVIRGRAGRVRGAVGSAVACLVVAALAWQAWMVWDARMPSTQEEAAQKLAALGKAVRAADVPVVLVVEALSQVPSPTGYGTVSALRRFRAALPAGSIARSAVYLGDPAELLAGRPTSRGRLEGYDEVSRDAWRAVEPLLDPETLVVVLGMYHDRFAELAEVHPDWMAAPWLLVAQGDLPMLAEDPPTLAPPTGAELARWTAWAFLVPTVVGLGWAVALGRGPLLGRVALAPVIGIAALILAGVVLEALGLRVGTVGAWSAVLLALGGGVASGWAYRRDLSATRSG